MNYDEIIASVLPRVKKLDGKVAQWSPRAGAAALADLASLPGRAYASLGRPQGEGYLDAMGRTGPTLANPSSSLYQGEGDELAETVLRDPTLPLGMGLARLGAGLGTLGRAGVDAVGNAGLSAGSQYASEGRVDPLGTALAAGLGAAPHVMPRAPGARAAMISPEERAANFRNWFGDSKVVDEAGNPLVVYHGSKYGAPAEFKPGKGYIGTAYFTDDLSNAKKWAQGFTPEDGDFIPNDGRFSGDVVEAYISAKKPITDETTLDDIYGDAEKAQALRDEEFNFDPQPFTASMGDGSDLSILAHSYAQFPKFREYLKSQGYDAFDYYDMESGGRTIVPFDPAQIKSATGNRGTFDPNDPNITHLTAPAASTRTVAPTQALGSRLAAGAQAAVFRKFLSGDDDRARGDSYFTKARR